MDGDLDSERGVSDADCKAAEEACKKAGIDCSCEPSEMDNASIICHTMASREECAKALEAEGFNIDEQLSPEDSFEYEMSSIVGEQEDALVNGDGKTQEAAIEKLNGLMVQEFQAGVNGMNAITSLKGVIDDPELIEMFKKLGQKESTTDIRPLITKYVKAKAPNLVSKIEQGEEATPTEPTEDIKDKEDYMAKKKAIQDIQMDPHTHKDEKLKKEVIRKKAELDAEAKEKGYKEDDDTIDVKMNPDGSIEKDDKAMNNDDERTPGEKLEELVKSHYDYTSNSFPKGETAIVTACEKEFGDKAIPFAEKMISRLKAGKDREMERIKHLAGV
jgi:hypothetical protein